MGLEKAKLLAQQLMQEHNLHGWAFQFDNAKSRLGYCSYNKQLISLSKYYVELNDVEDIRDTILHEIAHALAPIGTSHGTQWKLQARAIGCNAKRCDDNAKMPPKKYTGICPVCKKESQRNRMGMVSCGKCSNVFDKQYLLTYKLN